jgi:drug/metabolite transporter (DMT)-like permease
MNRTVLALTAASLGPHRSLRGVLLALLGFFLFATSDAVVKMLTARYSVLQLIPVHVAFAALPVLVSTARAGDLRVLRPRHPRLVALRGLLAGVGTVLNFYAFSTLPLADVYAIIFGVPIVVAVLAVPVLGERADPHRWAAVLGGFAGILVMVRPQAGGALSLGHLAALASVFAGAGVTLILRRIGREERGAAVVLAVVLGLLVVSLPAAALQGARPPAVADIGLLAVSGTLMGVAQFVMLHAFRAAPASSVAPMQYTMMVWALLYGLLLFGDPIRARVVIGAGIVIVSSLYLMDRERQRAMADP